MVASRKQQQLCTSHMQDRSAALVTYFGIGMILENTMATVVVCEMPLRQKVDGCGGKEGQERTNSYVEISQNVLILPSANRLFYLNSLQ